MSTAINGEAAGASARGAPDERPEVRVLQVFHALGMGGAETWLIALLEWFAEMEQSLPIRVRFDICLTSGERAVLDDRAIALGARLQYVKFGRYRLAEFAREFRHLLRTNDYHVLHDHADFAGGLHLLIGLGTLPPIRIIHVHNPQAPLAVTLQGRLVRAVGRAAVKRLSTAVAGTSVEALHRAHYSTSGAHRQPRIAVHCGLDVRRYAMSRSVERSVIRQEFGWSGWERIILFVGRLESTFNQKNPEFALEVARACAATDSSARALFVGAGSEMRKRLEDRVAGWDMTDRIRFLGVRLDVPRLMCASDLLLFPSIAEGLGMVAVEAQAAGLRVLASDATPVECAVVPDMVEFKSLSESPLSWAAEAKRLLDAPAPDAATCREKVAASPFAIAHSARELLRLYGVAGTGAR